MIPRGGYVVFTSHDTAFRALYGGDRFVGGQFPGGLSSSGEQVQLLHGSTVVDEVTYGSVAPWPTTPNGTGPSLELLDPALDNAAPASWAASTNSGTPGLRNSVSGGGPPRAVRSTRGHLALPRHRWRPRHGVARGGLRRLLVGIGRRRPRVPQRQHHDDDPGHLGADDLLLPLDLPGHQRLEHHRRHAADDPRRLGGRVRQRRRGRSAQPADGQRSVSRPSRSRRSTVRPRRRRSR